jgi:hypothetical protein
VWKTELVADVGPNPGPRALVRVLHAQRGSVPEDLSLGAFMRRCKIYFEGGGRIIDQAFQPRLPEGMIRCYLARNEVAGFGHQLIKALVAPAGVGSEAAQPGLRTMHPAEGPAFHQLREKMEAEWVPAMQTLLDIPTASLPALQRCWCEFVHLQRSTFKKTLGPSSKRASLPQMQNPEVDLPGLVVTGLGYVIWRRLVLLWSILLFGKVGCVGSKAAPASSAMVLHLCRACISNGGLPPRAKPASTP